MLGFLNKLFGSKSDKDLKGLNPRVQEINKWCDQFSSLSTDELRAKTNEFKQRISTHTQNIAEEIAATQQQAEATADMQEKDQLYKKIDTLRKDENKAIEEVLEIILPTPHSPSWPRH
jgi:preprotein translocase subunit SecA